MVTVLGQAVIDLAPLGCAMASSAGQRQLLKFGIFEVDLAAGEIRKAGMRLKLAPQPFQVLQALLEHPQQTITREELRARVWPDNTFVDYELALKKAINRLREVLGDSAESPHFIETVPRRGYRFIGALIPFEPLQAHSSAGPHTIIRTAPRSSFVLTPWRLFTVVVVLLVGVAAGWRVKHWLYGQISFKQQRLTANSQEVPVLGGVISPNGQFLAFADKTGLYLRQIANGETHILNLPQGFNAVPAAWYPDGSHLIASWVEGPNSSSSLWQIPILGGASHRLTENGNFPSVSYDGSQISFIREQASNEELWVMGENGENPRRLLTATQGSSFGPPAWSPNGRQIAYVTATQELGQLASKMNISMLDLGSGQQNIIVSPQGTNPELDASAQLGWRMVWTADNHLVYTLSEPPPNQTDTNLWVLSLDSGGQTTGSASRLTATPGGVSDLNASADGRRMAYTKSSTTPTIYISEVHSDGASLSTPKRLTLDDWRDIAFAWTPDSKAVIFVSDRDGIFHIFKQQLDQNVAERLVGGSEEANIPRLAPDNSSLLYLAWPKVGNLVAPTRLMRVPLVGGPPQEVLRDRRIGNIQCARPPSAVCLYHVESATELSFFRFDPVTGKTEALPQFKIDNRTPAWNLSPDGKVLLTSSADGLEKNPSFNLYSLEDGSKRTVAVKGWAGINGIDFAADSKSVWVAANTNTGKWAVLNIGLQGKTRVMLEDAEMIWWVVAAPDGKHLAIPKNRIASNVWMVQRF
jgi:Tol biopolymer transport system component/DNA-binding winged helix-turn-helix (wHTH) protein